MFSSESIGHKTWVVRVSGLVKWLLGLSCTLVWSERGIHYLHSLNKSSPGQPLSVRYPVQTTLCASVFLDPCKPLAFLSETIQGLLTFRDKCCLRRKDYTSIFFSLSFFFLAVPKRSSSKVASKYVPQEAGTQRDRFLHHKVSADELLVLWLAESFENIKP